MPSIWSLKYLREYKRFSKGLFHKYGQNKNIKNGTKIKNSIKGWSIFFLLFLARRIFIMYINKTNVGNINPKILRLIANADTIANITAFL